MVGLYGAFIIGLITAILGGKPGMISGATGSVAVVFVGLGLSVKSLYPELDAEALEHDGLALHTAYFYYCWAYSDSYWAYEDG